MPTAQLAAIADRFRAIPRHVNPNVHALCDLVVVPTLREAIISNLLPPGFRLVEVTLAQQLKVSRTPVRESFAQLEREGLVTVLPRMGVFVREVSPLDVEEIYEVRAALESLAVSLATQRMSALGRAQLEVTVEAMRQRVEENDPVGYTEALDRFYALIMTLADNAALHRTHTGLLGPVRRLRRIAMSLPGRMRSSFDQAVLIKAAMENNDPAGAELVRVQLANARDAAKAVLSHD
ncbi:MAG: GntR family transcriptional regulator [Dyella sp.]